MAYDPYQARRAAAYRVSQIIYWVFGLIIGLVAALYSYALVREAFANVRGVGSLADEKNQALRGLQAISVILDDASTTSTDLTGSFDTSKTSLQTASGVASDVAANLRLIAQIVGLPVLGLQPLAGLAQPFVQSSERLDALAQDLSQTSESVRANAEDMQRLSGDFTRLKVEVDGLTRTVAALPANLTNGVEFARLETALSAILVWIGLQALAAIFGGLALVLLPLLRR